MVSCRSRLNEVQLKAADEKSRSQLMRRSILMLAGVVLVFGVVSMIAQESRSEISLQGTGFFTKDTSGRGTTQRTTETGGFLVWVSIQSHALARSRSSLRL